MIIKYQWLILVAKTLCNYIYRTSVLVSRTEKSFSLNVPSQFIELRPFYGAKGNSGIESLLEDVTDNQIEDAINLVNGKVIYANLQNLFPRHRTFYLASAKYQNLISIHLNIQIGFDRLVENVWTK